MEAAWTRELRGDAGQAELVVVQWNALADRLAHGSFLHAEPQWLDWAWRRERIVHVLACQLPVSADVLCLQEVDHFEELGPRLETHGYRGFFVPKARGRDGCCLFVNEERLRVISHESLRYRGEEGRSGSQVALAAELELRQTGTRLRVATTHLKAKPDFEQVRRSQAEQLLGWLSPSGSEALVVAGDFNDIPQSPAYQALARDLHSSYASTGHEPEWTTWKVRASGEVRRTIDYLWHSPRLEAVAWLDVPASADVPTERLPSQLYPSDHLSLACGYRWVRP